jgi:hypothetical protein
MKPFNLDKALAGEPVVTRCGYQVTHINHYRTADQSGFCITALVHGLSVEVETFKKTGYFTSGENGLDLFMAEPEAWINVYYSKVQEKIWNSVKYNSEEEAKNL